jgi:hypothetical protein
MQEVFSNGFAAWEPKGDHCGHGILWARVVKRRRPTCTLSEKGPYDNV